METEKKKFNPYVVVIIILLIVIAGLTYNKWGAWFSPTKEPEPKPNNQILEGDISVGNEDALVTIVEYYSYFCSYCKMFHDETYLKIVEDYISNGKVKYIFRAYPPFELGTAVLCANDQDKFLEYHDSLFEKASEIQAVDDLKVLAKDIGLDETKFNQCFDSQKYLAKAQEWYEQGDKDFENAGVPPEERGTPSFLINGELLIGAQPFDKFVEVIEKKLGE